MKNEIARVVENARLLAALLENHPAIADLPGTAHCPDDEHTPATVAFSGSIAIDVVNAFGGGWTARPSRRHAGMDAHKTVAGVLLIIRDFQNLHAAMPVEA